MYSVYILYSEEYDKFYIGQSNDIGRRLQEHNEGEIHKYTSKYRPWQLVLSLEISEFRSEAIHMERFLKKQKSKEFIRRFISEKKIRNDIKSRFVRSVPKDRD